MALASWTVWWVSISRPWALLAAGAAAIPILIALWGRRRGRRVSGFAVAAQSLAVALAAVALAHPAVPLGRARRPYMLLEDTSASTRGQSDKPLPWPEAVPLEKHDFAATILGGRDRNTSETNVSAALHLALARSAELGGVVLRSDGQFHDTDWRGVAAALGASGIDFFIVPMESPPADARVSDLTAALAPDGKCRLRVTVASNAAAARTLRVWREDSPDEPLLQRRLDMLAGESATIRLADAKPTTRAGVYVAALSGGDAFAENDSARTFVLPLRRRVALVASGSSALAPLTARLPVAVDKVSPASAPDDAAGWMDYSAAIVIDDDGNLLAPRQREALGQYVRGGGGLLLVGAGPRNTPADRQDPLNRVAALLANPYERRPLKVVVVLDSSGSMGRPARRGQGAARVKFDLAAEAVMALKRHLTGSDALAVVVFSDRPRLIYDSGAAVADFAALRDAMGKVAPAGPTKAGPALNLAAIVAGKGGKRAGLVILVSDLLTEPFDVDATAEKLRLAGASLAVVAIGSESPPAGGSDPRPAVLEALAGKLDAPLIRRDHLVGLAKIFGNFLRNARGDAVRRGRFSPAAGASLFGTASPVLPTLDAYILTARQGDAEVLARVGADPLIARRQVGLGRSACVAAPLTGPDNAGWQNSPAVHDLLAAAVRWCLRPGSDPRFAGRCQRRGGLLTVEIDARTPAGPINALSLTVAVIQPNEPAAKTRETPLVQTGPGRYEAEVPAGAGPLGIIIRQGGPDSSAIVYQDVLRGGYPPEFSAIGANWQNLRRLKALTGGRIVSAREIPKLLAAMHSRRYTPIWPYLLAAALAAMLAEWCLVRISRRDASAVIGAMRQ